MIYTKKGYTDQHVPERERTRANILERSGWKRVETPPQAEAPTAPSALPDDFPAVEALRVAGLTTVEAVRAYADLTEIPGIGKTTAEKIHARLAE